MGIQNLFTRVTRVMILQKVNLLQSEFTPSVGFTLHFKSGSGNNTCIDYVKFDEAWPNTRNGRPPKPDYGNYFLEECPMI